MKTTVKRGLILRFVGNKTTNIFILLTFTASSWCLLYVLSETSAFASEMRGATQTTRLISSSTCIQRRGRVCLTAEKMFLVICSRFVTLWFSVCWSTSHGLAQPL